MPQVWLRQDDVKYCKSSFLKVVSQRWKYKDCLLISSSLCFCSLFVMMRTLLPWKPATSTVRTSSCNKLAIKSELSVHLRNKKKAPKNANGKFCCESGGARERVATYVQLLTTIVSEKILWRHPGSDESRRLTCTRQCCQELKIFSRPDEMIRNQSTQHEKATTLFLSQQRPPCAGEK